MLLWEFIEIGISCGTYFLSNNNETGPQQDLCSAQSMFAAIKARFGGNKATKKTQKALLKQQYENFNASSSESLDSIFNRLQKLVSRLAILGVVTPPEDLNVKFLRSLPSEWDTHVVVWMNKPDFDTMGLDDLYNNFNIVEQKVKRSAGANNDDKNLAFLTTSEANLKVEYGPYKIGGQESSILTNWKDRSSLMEAVCWIWIKSKGRMFSNAIKWDILPENAVASKE
ncbi:hypothetical protein Tco_0750730 [Tanacetum coccineum]|uniref:Uncharacterized protein n=1 Tax=Tanacetum coccineum TaxID=301880 RepID=A0ABQ4Z222_9ASTR